MVSSVEKMTRHLEKQGATVKKTKKGIFIQTPLGWTTMHFTYGDHRSQLNDIARLRKIGLQHPEDNVMPQKKKRPDLPDGYPSYVGGTLTKQSREKFLAFLRERDWPIEVTVPQLRDYGANMVVAKCLYLLGYRYHPDGKKLDRSIVWVAPEDIVNLHNVARQRKVLGSVTPVANDVEPEPAYVNPGPTIEETADPVWLNENTEPALRGDLVESVPTSELISEEPPVREAEEPVEHIDYIDERDSWTVDPKELFGSVTYNILESRLNVLAALGIEFEIRVWRKK